MPNDNPKVLHYLAKVAATKKITVSLRSICKRRWLWLWLTLVLLALPLTILAQDGDTTRPTPVILTEEKELYPLGLHLEILEDPGGQLTIEDVSSFEYDDQFTPSQDDIPNLGYTAPGAAVWARFRVRNEADPNIMTWVLALAEERHGYVDMYAPVPDGSGLVHQQAGRLRPFSVREVPYRYSVFKPPLLPGQDQTVYLRFQSPQPMILPLTLLSLEAFANQMQTDLLKYGLFFGVMLVMLGYNLFLYASLRDRSYLYLVLFIACFGLHIGFRSGLAKQYLAPDRFTLDTLKITTSLSLITLILFTISFLQTNVRTPRLHKVLVGVIFLTVLAMFDFVSRPFPAVRNYMILLGMFAVIAASISTWWQGYRPARYYLLAWLFFLGIIIINSLINIGLMPEIYWAQQRLLLGAMVMVLLLSLALSDRINLLQAETSQANRFLRNSEYRLNQFLEAVPAGLVVYDKAAKLSYINQQARQLLSMPTDSATPDELGPSLDQEIVRLSPWVAGSAQPYPPELMPIRRALQGEFASVDDMEIQGLEERVQLEVWASPIFDEEKHLQYAIAAFQDITRRKQMELELRNHRDQLEEVVVERTEELASFLDLTMLISDNYNLDEVLQGALDRIIDFGLCQAVCVHLVAEDQAHLKMFTSHGLSKIQHDQLQRLPLDGDLSEWFTDRQKQVLTLDLSSVTTSITPLRLEGYNYLLGVPMDTRSQILGLISYYRAEDQPYSLDDISMLTALAEQLRIIIENHRLRDEIEEIAIVSERQRLARDMHDSINQSLYSLGLFTLAGREAAEDGDTERLIKSLKRIEEISLDARREMRLLLHQLRPPILTGLGLAEALQYRFDTVERSLGTRVDYQVDGHLDLPDKTAEGLYWVTLEILNNSLKHSKANQVTVRMEMVAPTINMKVSDNGIGFNPELASGGMGLKNIEERIDEMDGCLKISSAPGEGTTIEFAVSVPEMSDTGED